MKCEVCGKDATFFVNDLKEKTPVSGFEMWELHSRHAFCEGHKRAPRQYKGEEVWEDIGALQSAGDVRVYDSIHRRGRALRKMDKEELE